MTAGFMTSVSRTRFKTAGVVAFAHPAPIERYLEDPVCADSAWQGQYKFFIGILFQQPFHRRIRFIQRGIELGRVFAAGFGHVWASAAGAADFFRDRS